MNQKRPGGDRPSLILEKFLFGGDSPFCFFCFGWQGLVMPFQDRASISIFCSVGWTFQACVGKLLSWFLNGWPDFVSLLVSFRTSDLLCHACEAGGAALCTATLTR